MDDQFSKGKKLFSNDTYKVADKIGYILSVINDNENKSTKKFKPSELLKVNKVDNPISKSYFEEDKQDKIISFNIIGIVLVVFFPEFNRDII